MKVMQLLSSVKHDDSERGIYHICHALLKKGHESIIVACGNDDDEFVVRLTREGSDYYKLPMPKKSWLSLRQVFKLKKLIEQHRPDIIHVHSRTPAWVLYWSLKLIKKKHKAQLKLQKNLNLDNRPTEYYFPKTISIMYGFYPFNSYSKALFETDILISASKSIDRYIKSSLIEFDDYKDYVNNVICVRRGVDVRIYPYRHKPSVHWLQHIFAEFPQLEHKKWIIFPTHIGQEYGQEWLIDIIGNLKEKFPKLHIIIMDNDNTEGLSHADLIIYNDFRQRLTELGLDDFVSFVGRKPIDLRDWLSSAHIVLALANQPQSIGLTVLQAIHLGTPVIGWNKGAFEDILAALYPRGLIKNQSATALCRAIASQLETGVRPSITNDYEIETMVDKTLSVYNSLIQPSKPETKKSHKTPINK